MSNLKMAKIVAAFNSETNTVVPDSDAVVQSTNKSSDLGGSTTYYSNVSDLPISAPAFTKALVTSTNTLYQYNGGWYPIALINNFSPSFSVTPNASYTLGTDGTATTVTVLATDSDDVPVNYTVVTDSGFDAIATVTHDSEKDNVWVIRSIDSDGSASKTDGSGTITFKASDGVNIATTSASTFTLAFGVDWTNVSQTLITANTPGTTLYFGQQVAVSEDGTYIVGNNGASTSVFDVFLKSGGSYTHQASFSGTGSTYLGGWDGWGTAVQMDDDGERIVANQGTSSVGTNRGIIYVFKRTGTSWAQEYSATSTDAVDHHRPGVAAISGDGVYIAQGFKYGESASQSIGYNSGEVTVWSRSGSTWSQQATFNANPEDYDGYFGSSLAFNTDGTYLAVGSTQNDPTGQFYVMTRSGSTWTQQQGPIRPSDYSGYEFGGDDAGCSIDIDENGTTIVLGAIHHDGSGGVLADSGAIYVFTRSGSTWTQQQGPIFASDAAAGAQFGNAVSISKDGNTIAVGARLAQSSSGSIAGGGAAGNSGKVYIFQRSGSTWSQIAVYDGARNGSNEVIPGAGLGISVGLSGDGNTLVAGANLYDPVYNGGSSLPSSGALVVIN